MHSVRWNHAAEFDHNDQSDEQEYGGSNVRNKLVDVGHFGLFLLWGYWLDEQTVIVIFLLSPNTKYLLTCWAALSQDEYDLKLGTFVMAIGFRDPEKFEAYTKIINVNISNSFRASALCYLATPS